MRSAIGFLAGLGAPWWLCQFAMVPSLANAGGVVMCLGSLLYLKMCKPACCASACESEKSE